MIIRSKANTILNDLFSKSYYIGLSTTEPTVTGTNFSEPASSTGYKRVQLSVMGTASDGQIQNSDIIFFPESLEAWGTITHFGVFTNSSGNTPHYVGALNEAVTIPVGYVPIFRAAALKVGLDKETLA